jgi:hypothetical protein
MTNASLLGIYLALIELGVFLPTHSIFAVLSAARFWLLLQHPFLSESCYK